MPALAASLIEGAREGVTMNWPPAAVTCSTSAWLRTVPAPTRQPAGAAARTSRMASSALGVVRAISTYWKPSSMAASAALAAAPPSFPRTMPTRRACRMPANNSAGVTAAFCDVSVGVAPHRSAPGVAALVRCPHHGLINFDAESGPGEPLDVAVDELERRLVHHVVQDFGALVVVDPDALFLDEEVGRGEAHLQAGRERQGAQRAVRRQLDFVHFGQRGDLA